MIRRVLATIGLLGCMSLVACGPDFERLQIGAVNLPDETPQTEELNYQRVDVVEGTAVTARIEPFNDDGKSMHLEVRSMRPDILEVSNAVNDRVFFFAGYSVGRTQVEFYADDELVLIIDAEVLPQQ